MQQELSCAGKESDASNSPVTYGRTITTGSTEPKPCGGKLVITEENAFRKSWNLVVVVLLCYIGTIFPYKLCFIEFGMPEPMEASRGWQAVEMGVDILFWFDLVFNFFCSYQDDQHNEVVVLKDIACNYLRWYFWLNLIACLPPSAFQPLFSGQSPEAETPSINQATRMLRFQRLTRLVRLGRLARLKRMLLFLMQSPVIRNLRSSNGMRIMTLIFGLLWVVHLVGCGWFLCASLHDNHLDTWVARRRLGEVDSEGRLEYMLLDCGPYLQWWHASYFTLTVFTTVGFGDMYATTSGEIAYVSFTMILGAIINSIIVGEVINIVTTADREHIKIREHKANVEAFCEHTDLDNATKLQMSAWIEQVSSSFDYDDACMLKMLTSGCLPRVLLEQLPYQMFDGQLARNSFVTLCSNQVRHVPPRFSVLLALKVYQIVYVSGEFVYHYNDHPFNLFLVRSGIFAHVAKVGKHGGFHEVPQVSNVHPKEASLMSKMRGVLMPGSVDPNEAQHAFNAALSVNLFPYKLLGMMSYFGDAELLTGKARQSSVRCESTSHRQSTTSEALILGLHKHDYFELMREYPHFARAWRAAALRHDRQHHRALGALRKDNCSKNHRVLAGDVLLRFMSRFKERKDPRPISLTKDPSGTQSEISEDSASPTRTRQGSTIIDTNMMTMARSCGNLIKPNKTSYLHQNFRDETSSAELATLHRKMVNMEDHMSNLQGSVDGIHSLLENLLANQKSKTLHDL